MKKTFIFSLFIFFSSCTTHRGLVLEQGPILQDERIIKSPAIGYSKATYFLGLGKKGRNSIIYDAKNELYNCRLNEKEVFENLTIDIKTTFFLFYIKKEVFILADVVEYPNSNLNNINDHLLWFNRMPNEKIYAIDKNEIKYSYITGEFNSLNQNVNQEGSSPKKLTIGAALINEYLKQSKNNILLSGYQYPSEEITFLIKKGGIQKIAPLELSNYFIFNTSYFIDGTRQIIEGKTTTYTHKNTIEICKIMGIYGDFLLIKNSWNQYFVVHKSEVDF